MDMQINKSNLRAMPKPSQKRTQRPKRDFRPLYIGQWIRALHKRPADVVRETKINEGYLSELISGQKKNPSGDKLLQIAEYLDIPMNYFYQPPPDKEFLEQVSEIDPGVLSKLRSNA